MKKGNAYTLAYRRKREGKTDYRTRLKFISSNMFRVIVRISFNNILVQIVGFDLKGDKVLVSSHSRELIKYGWKAHRGNLPSSYLVGFLCGLKALQKGIDTGIIDFGFNRVVKGSSLFGVSKGLIDSGFKVKVNESFLPSEDRVSGKHIEDYAKKVKDSEVYKKRDQQNTRYHFFGVYLRQLENCSYGNP